MSKGFASVAIAALIIGGGIVMLLNLTGTPTLEPAVPLSPDPAPIRKYDVVAEYPHDPEALTQALIYRGGGYLSRELGLRIKHPDLIIPGISKSHAFSGRRW